MRVSQAKKRRSHVEYVAISAEYAGQRIDNFIILRFKGMPKSRVYRLLRKGEVRVNKKRISPFYRLQIGDNIRLPPVFLDERAKLVPPSQETMALLKKRIIYENEDLLVLNKPSGMSVHQGNTVRVGVVEALRHMYPKCPHLELAHRLDSETSGCLILAKKKRVLREIHSLLRAGEVNKIYCALTKGQWKETELTVNLPLQKNYREGGKQVVEVHLAGKAAVTVFQPIKTFMQATLVEVKLLTGRTHQIRVHASHQGHPIAGDDRYGEAEFNKLVRQMGLKRMFLHAKSIDFTLPSTGEHITVIAQVDPELLACIEAFEHYEI